MFRTIVQLDRIATAGRQQQHDRNGSSRRVVGRVLGGASAALLFVAAIIQPQVVNADDGGGSHHGFGHFRAVFGFGGAPTTVLVGLWLSLPSLLQLRE
jgi:hypothetical protein